MCVVEENRKGSDSKREENVGKDMKSKKKRNIKKRQLFPDQDTSRSQGGGGNEGRRPKKGREGKRVLTRK